MMLWPNDDITKEADADILRSVIAGLNFISKFTVTVCSLNIIFFAPSLKLQKYCAWFLLPKFLRKLCEELFFWSVPQSWNLQSRLGYSVLQDVNQMGRDTRQTTVILLYLHSDLSTAVCVCGWDLCCLGLCPPSSALPTQVVFLPAASHPERERAGETQSERRERRAKAVSKGQLRKEKNFSISLGKPLGKTFSMRSSDLPHSRNTLCPSMLPSNYRSKFGEIRKCQKTKINKYPPTQWSK